MVYLSCFIRSKRMFCCFLPFLISLLFLIVFNYINSFSFVNKYKQHCQQEKYIQIM